MIDDKRDPCVSHVVNMCDCNSVSVTSNPSKSDKAFLDVFIGLGLFLGNDEIAVVAERAAKFFMVTFTILKAVSVFFEFVDEFFHARSALNVHVVQHLIEKS